MDPKDQNATWFSASQLQNMFEEQVKRQAQAQVYSSPPGIPISAPESLTLQELIGAAHGALGDLENELNALSVSLQPVRKMGPALGSVPAVEDEDGYPSAILALRRLISRINQKTTDTAMLVSELRI
ncbi:hypothetical protein [Burkholderia thailandensis]|uniref:hypothetical protein n=1 Tax=Burkholderia thailandensis TaxID=57975 RepID=UPI00107EC620|nr:hypothetical protein [Burkholderia thailandensis]TGB34386.1 hypothetical protein C6946_07095 [Burkholderia thailandensis]